MDKPLVQVTDDFHWNVIERVQFPQVSLIAERPRLDQACETAYAVFVGVAPFSKQKTSPLNFLSRASNNAETSPGSSPFSTSRKDLAPLWNRPNQPRPGNTPRSSRYFTNTVSSSSRRDTGFASPSSASSASTTARIRDSWAARSWSASV